MNYKKYKSLKVSIFKSKQSKNTWVEKERPVRKMNDGSYGIVYNNQVFKLHQPNIIYLDDKKYNLIDCTGFVLSREKLVFNKFKIPREIEVFEKKKKLNFKLKKRPIRLIKENLYGVVYQGKVYPVYENNKIDIAGRFYRKDNCIGFLK